ncbi:ankyrin repeat domain-containing protein [Fictibacillus phosphorivorans]|uniref:ankyrin repeat domain-containing protein n=1 Tax=Fictibacillus phosphorivorans TaxID=1221500 RepID=UPI003CFACFBC
MPTDKADIFTIARFGDISLFKKKFTSEKINEKDEFGIGLLHHSIAGKNFDIATFLIKNRIDVNMTDGDGNTSLHVIAEHPNINVAKEILDRGGDINIRNTYGNNALWTAVVNCKGRYYDLIDLFMKYDPDTKSKNNAGRSPIEFAKQVANRRLISMLEM